MSTIHDSRAGTLQTSNKEKKWEKNKFFLFIKKTNKKTGSEYNDIVSNVSQCEKTVSQCKY